MMLINGEKYACEACVRGHRVSSCTHSDRKLLHVNKKGRPVSQCQHCRSLRKARSQHVKCECNDKAHTKEDCPHLKTEGGANLENIVPAPLQSADSLDSNSCCCGHGAKCTCSLKKEPGLITVHEDLLHPAHHKEHHKSRISSLNNHEGKPTIFSNGHHKLVHKINDAHNHCGMPYKVPSRSHTANGHRDLAERSTDSLPILKQAPRHAESPLHNSITSAPRDLRQTKSEHGSPDLGPVNPSTSGLLHELYIPPLSPTAYAYSPFPQQNSPVPLHYQHEPHLPETIPESWFTTYDEAHAMEGIPSAGYRDGPAVDWSSFDLAGVDPNYSANGLFPNQNPSYANSFDHSSFPGLPRMNSSSGDVSEVEETYTSNRPSNLRTVSNASNDLDSHDDDRSDTYRLSTASSFFSAPQANLLAGNLDNLDIDEYVKQTVDQQRRMTSQSQSSQLTGMMSTATPPAMRQASVASQISPHIHIAHSPEQQITHEESIDRSNITSNPATAQPENKTFNRPNTSFGGGGEHAFTISEAQAYAHMQGGDENQERKTESPMPVASMAEDPMWCSTPADPSTFILDDEREDEDWVR